MTGSHKLRSYSVFSLLALASVTLAVTNSYASIPITVELPKAPVVEGTFFKVSVSSPRAMTHVEGRFMGRTIQFYPDTTNSSGEVRMSALVGVDVDRQTGDVPFEISARSEDDATTQTGTVQVLAGEFPSETLTVQPRKVSPLPKDLPRIRREQKLVGRVYKNSANKVYWDPPLVMPIDSAITSIFGSKRVYNGVKQSAHYGTDLRAKSGTPVLAPLSGRVALAQNLFFTGGTIIIDHGYGLFTIYAHLSRLKVKVGDEVKKGAKIALSGATGRVSGPHLHWGVNLHGVKVDPMALVNGLK